MIPVLSPALFMPKTVVSTFVGVGDVKAGALLYGGLRTYTAASIGTNLMNVRRSSDSTLHTFISRSLDGSFNPSDPFFDGSTYTVENFFDTTGNGNVFNFGGAAAPVLSLTSGPGGKPGLTFTAASQNRLVTTAVASAQPFTMSLVARFNNLGTQSPGIASNNTPQMSFNISSTTPNTAFIYAAGTVGAGNAPCTDGVWHAINGVFNGAISSIMVNGTNTTGLNPGPGTLGSAMAVGFDTTNYFNGLIAEFSVWGSALNTTELMNVNNNQQAYWGI